MNGLRADITRNYTPRYMNSWIPFSMSVSIKESPCDFVSICIPTFLNIVPSIPYIKGQSFCLLFLFFRCNKLHQTSLNNISIKILAKPTYFDQTNNKISIIIFGEQAKFTAMPFHTNLYCKLNTSLWLSQIYIEIKYTTTLFKVFFA